MTNISMRFIGKLKLTAALTFPFIHFHGNIKPAASVCVYFGVFYIEYYNTMLPKVF